ncbi:hypothetical protein BDBG_16135, partial [Blastomyces gilchristii SLH14081]
SSHIDRSAFINDSELNIKSLIENLKNMIMKKLSILCMTESSVSLSALSVSFSVTLSQSSTPALMSGSSASAISVSESDSLTSAISASSGSAVSTFIISSSHFKKILYRLNESHFSFLVTSVSEIILIEDDNTAETTLFYSQASSITFSSFSAEKVIYILS